MSTAKKSGLIGDPLGLLHVVGHDGHGIFFFKLHHQLFDLAGGNGIEGRARFVHEQHLRFGGNRSGNAKALLLSAGQGKAVVFELVFHLVPERRTPQGLLHFLIHVALETVEPQTKGNVFVYGHGKRVRLLKHHADVAPHGNRVDFIVVNVHAVEVDPALETKPADEVIHAVDTFKHRAFTTARRSDEAGDLVFADGHMAVANRQEIAIIDLLCKAVEDHITGSVAGQGLMIDRLGVRYP